MSSEFRDEELEISLSGWQQEHGELRKQLPEGLSVQYPAILPGSPGPLLPLMIRVDRPLQGIESLTLVLLIEVNGEVTELEVEVALPRLAVFELVAPEEVRAFPDRPTVFSIFVRNIGNTEGSAQLTFQGLNARAHDTRVPAGGERVVQIELPPLAGGDTILTVALAGGGAEQRHQIRVSGVGSGNRSGYGLLATIRSESKAQLKHGMAPLEGNVSLTLQGNLSRTTYLDATVERSSFSEFPDARLWLRHRGSSLELGDSSKISPAGEVGVGFYLTQSLVRVPLLDELALGLALPTNGKEENARFGVRFDAGRLGSTVSLDLTGSDLLAKVRADFTPFNVSFDLSPSRETVWEARVRYSTRAFSVRFEGKRAAGKLVVAAVQRYSAPPTPLGRLVFEARSELRDWRFAKMSFKVSGVDGQLAFTMTPESGFLEADYRFSADPLELKLGASAPSWGAGLANLGLDAAFPGGPLHIDAGTKITSAGGLDARATAGYAAPFQNGQLSATAGLELNDTFGQPNAVSELGLDYADYGGIRAQLGATLPLLGGGPLELRLALSYSNFLPSPSGLARKLDGPDPTARRLTLLLNQGGSLSPLEGVRVMGCGPTAQTDTTGTALLSGLADSCHVTIESESLPRLAFASDEILTLEPGASETLILPTATELVGHVLYRDRETGEVLAAGPSRQVRVVVEGPVTRWSTVSLPAGEFRMERIPIGDYQAYVVGTGKRVPVTLVAEYNEVLLTVPTSRRTILDPAAVTPPVRVDLTPLLATPGEPVRLSITSQAQIVRIVVRLAGAEAVFDWPGEAGGRRDFEVPVPAGTAGAMPVEVEIRFEAGQIARRSLQLIVAGDSAHQLPEPDLFAPGASDSDQPSRRQHARDQDVIAILGGTNDKSLTYEIIRP